MKSRIAVVVVFVVASVPAAAGDLAARVQSVALTLPHPLEPQLARLRDQGTVERYLVGWRTQSNGNFHLAVVDGGGAILEGPQSVGAAGIGWGNRDDSFRSNDDGSVTWLEGNASSSTLRLFRYTDDLLFADGFESGTTAAWSAVVP